MTKEQKLAIVGLAAVIGTVALVAAKQRRDYVETSERLGMNPGPWHRGTFFSAAIVNLSTPREPRTFAQNMEPERASIVERLNAAQPPAGVTSSAADPLDWSATPIGSYLK